MSIREIAAGLEDFDNEDRQLVCLSELNELVLRQADNSRVGHILPSVLKLLGRSAHNTHIGVLTVRVLNGLIELDHHVAEALAREGAIVVRRARAAAALCCAPPVVAHAARRVGPRRCCASACSWCPTRP